MRSRWIPALLLGLAAVHGAPAQADCAQTRATLSSELAKRYASPDDPAVLERRDRLMILFAQATPECAEALHDELGPADDGGELSHAFHYALATPTRKRLLEILSAVYTPLRGLQQQAAELSDADESREIGCWLEKLDERGHEADDRVVEWSRLKDGADDLAPLVRSAADVDALGSDARLFTYVYNVVEMSALEGGGGIVPLQQLHDGARTAIDELDASSANAPPQIIAIHAWVQGQRSNANSLLSCL